MEGQRRHAQNTRRMDTVINRNICRRFINSTCRLGSRCNYQHEWPVLPSSQICRYFQKGTCWYGENCRYLHVLVGDIAARSSVPTISSSRGVYAPPDRRGSVPAPLQTEVTARQECSRSELAVNVSNPQHNTGSLPVDIAEQQTQDSGFHLAASRESGITQASACGRHTAQEAFSSQSTGDGAGAAAAAAAPAPAPAPTVASTSQSSLGDIEAYHQSKNVTCGICMETVYEKTDSRRHMFGILPNCNHSYCLQCIKTWRKTKDLGPDTVKTCPQCRVRSGFYVPHKYWVEGPEKESLITNFKERLGKKSCTYYSRYGCCPFKSECLYWHDKHTRCQSFQYAESDDDDYDGVDLLEYLMAMTLLGGGDDDDDDDDFYLPFYLAEEYGF